MPLALMPGTILHELVSLRPYDQAQVLGLMLDRWRGGGHEPYWAERLTVNSCLLNLGQIQAPSEDLLQELARDRWQRTLKDCFFEAVAMHGVEPRRSGPIPSLFQAVAVKHAHLASALRRVVDIERAVPRLIDRLASCYLAAVSETLDLEGLRRLNVWLEEGRREVRQIREVVLTLKKTPAPLCAFNPAGFDGSLNWLDRILDGFNVRTLRRRFPTKGQGREVPFMILRAAETLDGDLAALLRGKLKDPGFAGSEREKRLQHFLGYWDWDKPSYWLRRINEPDRR